MRKTSEKGVMQNILEGVEEFYVKSSSLIGILYLTFATGIFMILFLLNSVQWNEVYVFRPYLNNLVQLSGVLLGLFYIFSIHQIYKRIKFLKKWQLVYTKYLYQLAFDSIPIVKTNRNKDELRRILSANPMLKLITEGYNVVIQKKNEKRTFDVYATVYDVEENEESVVMIKHLNKVDLNGLKTMLKVYRGSKFFRSFHQIVVIAKSGFNAEVIKFARKNNVDLIQETNGFYKVIYP